MPFASRHLQSFVTCRNCSQITPASGAGVASLGTENDGHYRRLRGSTYLHDARSRSQGSQPTIDFRRREHVLDIVEHVLLAAEPADVLGAAIAELTVGDGNDGDVIVVSLGRTGQA